MDIILGIFLKGAGWVQLWQGTLARADIGATLFGLVQMTFRRKLT